MDRLMVCVVGMSACQSKQLTSGGVLFQRKGRIRKMNRFFDGLEMVLESLLEWIPGWCGGHGIPEGNGGVDGGELVCWYIEDQG